MNEPKSPICKKILEFLVLAGVVKDKHTGEVSLTLHINQGGVTDSKVCVSERLK
jgi:hypothetical protein